MKKFAKTLLVTTLLATAAATFGAEISQELKAVQQSMKARLKTVVELKANGAVGENNLGYLTLRDTANKEAAEVLKAENADRKKVYDATAKGNASVTSKQVGQLRAAEIVKKAKVGEYLQAPDGKWYQKGSDDDPNQAAATPAK